MTTTPTQPKPKKKTFKEKQRELIGTISYHRKIIKGFVFDAALAAKYTWSTEQYQLAEYTKALPYHHAQYNKAAFQLANLEADNYDKHNRALVRRMAKREAQAAANKAYLATPEGLYAIELTKEAYRQNPTDCGSITIDSEQVTWDSSEAKAQAAAEFAARKAGREAQLADLATTAEAIHSDAAAGCANGERKEVTS